MALWRVFTAIIIAICWKGCVGAKVEQLKVDVIGKAEHCEVKSKGKDVVSYHYCGRLTNGEEFDCSFNYGGPYIFTVGKGQVIEGMDKALTGVCVGDRLKITIPPHMAYGEGGSGNKIPPGATLIFWVKILQIERDGVNVVEPENMVDIFDKGKQAYFSENWPVSLYHMSTAAQLYNKQVSAITSCWSKCQQENNGSHLIGEAFVTFSYCVQKCEKRKLGRNFRFMDKKKIVSSLNSREVYNYMQHAQFKMGSPQEAASAAITYVHFNPTETSGHSNVRFYSAQKSVSTDVPIQGNPLPHVNAVRDAVAQYNAHNFEKSVELFEKAINLYRPAMEACFAECERNDSFAVPQTGSFTYDLALNYRNLLRCQLECPHKLEKIAGTHWDHLWAELYNFLQFSYFKVGKLDEAAAAVATAVLLWPDHKESRNNAVYYAKQGAAVEKFSAREEVISLLQELKSMRELAAFAEDTLTDNPAEDEMEVVEDHERTTRSSKQEWHPEGSLFSRGQFAPLGPPKAPITRLDNNTD